MEKIIFTIILNVALALTLELSVGARGECADKGWPDNRFTRQVPKPAAVAGPYKMLARRGDSFRSAAESKADGIMIAVKWDTMDEAKAYAVEVKAAGFTRNESVVEEDGTKTPIKFGDREVFAPSKFDWKASNGEYSVEVLFYAGGTAAVKEGALTIAKFDPSEE
ncbi:MAG: hypothetical protein LBR61_10375 [Synergistaceae bacterium]|jgi:hypothetical protein|nr:hypothetical protein [Synergistaceae bacterium]